MADNQQLVGGRHPEFRAGDAARMTHDLFGASGVARDLGGERDQSFLIEDGPRRCVLKISNADEDAAVLDFEAAALAYVAATDPGLPIAAQIPLAGAGNNGLGALLGVVGGTRGSDRHYVRLFEFVDGRCGTSGAHLSGEAVRGYGEIVARLGLALRGFFHPAAGRQLLWDVQQTPRLRPLLPVVEAAERRTVIDRVITRFESRVLPDWPRLRAQVVHGDLILENVMLDQEGAVCGIIDFGDLVHSSILQDISASLASILRKRSGDDVFVTARRFLDGYTARTALEPIELGLLGTTLCARLAAIVVIGTSQIDGTPAKAARFGELVDDSWRLLQELEAGGHEALSHGLGAPKPHAATSDLQRKRPQLLGEALAELFYATPVHVARGQGPWLIDVEGRRLLDGYNNVAIVGHCHPRVTEAVVDQTRRLNTHSRYLYEPLFDLAERLLENLAEDYGLDTVMIVNSGSEANDLAWRIATTWTGATGGIVSDCAYHGMTTAVSDLSPQQWPAGYRPAHVERFTVIRGGDDRYPHPTADSLDAAVARLLERDVRPAAMYLECGFISDGIVTPRADDLIRATSLARDAGALIVVDEVQMGHARSGGNFWSFQGFGIRPDVITLGKPMGNGYPVAAVITRSDLVSRFAGSTYFFSTFGGNPVAARAAVSVLDVIQDERLLEHAARTGELLLTELELLQREHAIVQDVRGQGLLAGVELVDPAGVQTGSSLAKFVVDDLRDRGVLIGRTGATNDVLKIRPPLVFGEDHVRVLVEALDAALESASRSAGTGSGAHAKAR